MEALRFRVVLCLMMLVSTEDLAAAPWRAGAGNTPGWTLMSPRERIEHQARIRAFTDYAACRDYQLQHHERMAARARSAGRPLGEPAHDACAHLRRAPPP